MGLILILLAPIVLLLLLLFKSEFEKRKFIKALRGIPGPKRYPIIGTNLKFLTSTREEIFQEIINRVKTYGSPYRTWLGPLPGINLNTPEHVELILNNSVYIQKDATYKLIEPWLQKGLLTSGGDYWRRNRKLITPTFHFTILEQFVEIFDENSRKMVTKLNEKANRKAFNIYPNITHCALDIICETAMGVTVNAMDDPNSEYVSGIYSISRLLIQRLISPWYFSDFIFYYSSLGKEFLKYLNILHGFTEKVINERKLQLKKENQDKENNEHEDLVGRKKRKAFLDMLLEASKGGTVINDLEIRQEVDTFMFEGHDTTTAAICWTLFLLGNHPEIQEKAFREQQEIFGGEDRPITMKDLGKMKYLEMIIKETLRLYPSVPFISRELTTEFEINGIKIPKGIRVSIQIFNIHHNPNVFPDPEKFDPDRFLPENTKKRHPFAFIPFSAGPRNCIGQKFAILEEKTMLSAIIRNFIIRSINTQEEIKLISELILRPQNGTNVTLEARN